MTRVVLDKSLRDRLGDLQRTVELCDESGCLVARILPAMDVVEWEPLGPDVSDQELERRSKSPGKRYTTAEVLAQLESL